MGKKRKSKSIRKYYFRVDRTWGGGIGVRGPIISVELKSQKEANKWCEEQIKEINSNAVKQGIDGKFFSVKMNKKEVKEFHSKAFYREVRARKEGLAY